MHLFFSSSMRFSILFLYIHSLSTVYAGTNIRLRSPCDINPVDDGPTADADAGIGVEFETLGIRFRNQDCPEDEYNKAKGKVVGGRADSNNMWELTADTTGAAALSAEYIINGKLVKIGTGAAGKAAEAILADLQEWAPSAKNSPNKIDIAGNKCNPWEIVEPKKEFDVETITWQRQITAPMPLEGIQKLLGMFKQDQSHELLPPPGQAKSGQSHAVWVQPAFLGSGVNGLTANKVTTEELGFLSLVLTYAKSADAVVNTSPKFLSPIMPRTGFPALFDEVRDVLEVTDTSKGYLYELISKLACYKNGQGETAILDTDFCNADLTPQRRWTDMEFSVRDPKKGTLRLSVKDWIDGIESGVDKLYEYDKNKKVGDGQIGLFKDATEKMIGANHRTVPLFEFRDLGSSKATEFKDNVESAEHAIQALHAEVLASHQSKHLLTRRVWERRCLSNSTSTNITTSGPTRPINERRRASPVEFRA